MRHRQISRFARRNRKGQADQIGGQGIQAVGFGIEGKHVGLLQPRQPVGKGRFVQDGDITVLRQLGLRQRFRRFRGYGRFGGAGGFRTRAFLVFQPYAGFHVRQPAFELVLFEQLLQRIDIRLGHRQLSAGQINSTSVLIVASL